MPTPPEDIDAMTMMTALADAVPPDETERASIRSRR